MPHSYRFVDSVIIALEENMQNLFIDMNGFVKEKYIRNDYDIKATKVNCLSILN